ncbi:hypothetical protein E5676_scaffold18G00740 [Cucumis melo var. makuwa]|uniref:Uncharacterized protein n=1 Tax=Cucumis melo var. makuwa TaxID=1194695 RepID=A0A5D3BTY8_CUCMM|nr:hypothetical protein E6C27_scaffold22G004760 [Cucumis melo var. makuwa]TYK02272.1 hypothetical protein E5676_scaffold18G00740 [Cucumis melo var. makuwa]
MFQICVHIQAIEPTNEEIAYLDRVFDIPSTKGYEDNLDAPLRDDGAPHSHPHGQYEVPPSTHPHEANARCLDFKLDKIELKLDYIDSRFDCMKSSFTVELSATKELLMVLVALCCEMKSSPMIKC